MTDLDDVVTGLRAGRSVVLPTDTVYGLCALPGVPGAIASLFELKGRGHETPVAVLCATAEQAFDLADEVVPAHQAVARRCWPGPLTLVLRRRASLAWELGEPADTIGVRVPDHPVVRGLAERLGPLAATSANRHGQAPARTVADVARQLGNDVPVLDAGELGEVASTVVDATEERWRVLRVGAIAVADLETAGAPI